MEEVDEKIQIIKDVCGGSGGSGTPVEYQGSSSSSVDSSADVNEANYDMDAVHLTKIFPLEVWEMIIEEVKCFNDLESLSNSSVVFREMLKGQRKLFLFSKVVEVLIPRYERSDSDEFGENQVHHPNVQRLAGLLRCRLVCSSWNKAVDNYYQGNLGGHYKMTHDLEQIQPEPTTLLLDNRNLRMSTWAHDVFSNFLPLENFIVWFNPTHCTGDRTACIKNPLIRRAVTFKTHHFRRNPIGTEIAYLRGMTALLIKYGQEIWYCTIDIPDSLPTQRQYYIKLGALLERMTNLKVFTITYTFSAIERNHDFHLRYCHDYQNEQLAQGIRLNPIPRREKLEMLKARNLPALIFNQLISQNNHILSLEVIPERLSPGPKFSIFSTVTMPNLTQLSISFYSERDYYKFMSDGATWTLEKLYLDCAFPTRRMNWARFFERISTNWGATLTNLMLRLPEPASFHSEKYLFIATKSTNLALPRLQRLKLILQTRCHIDFILPSKDVLRYIELDLSYDFYDTPTGQIVEFLGYEDRLLESNIWELFRKLDVVKLNVPRETEVAEGYTDSWVDRGNFCDIYIYRRGA